MADDENSMVCSLADRESDFETSKQSLFNAKTVKMVPKIVTTSDEEEDLPRASKKR